MDIPGDLSPILGSSLARLDATHLKNLRNHKLTETIDALGKLSASHSNNQTVLTSCAKLIDSDHVLYVAWEYYSENNVSRITGYIKVGRKQLYLFDNSMRPYEGSFVCLLDFYVHYSLQRKGIGSRLFEFMLENEHVSGAHQIPLDKPSATLLAFMAKHYGLNDPIWQSTNFVVFPPIFSADKSIGQNVISPPEGWSRAHSLPRCIGSNGVVPGTRYLENAISGHSAVKKQRQRLQDNGIVSGDIAHGPANSAIQARQRKQEVLSSRPLW
ncbi:GNAT acetyltransferase, mec-17 domain-containing protein [Ditylenchus destructor]|uniref:Alpha-tubulin N-acetyltransferase n=1 Tax=Ditylenchus destructor TaxID=166010 RepID=A0AAD4N2J1_9BILA|nr:GNAT acetyltransferase, mec-17 domain-containing protein [Ditylenchus destructor]